MMRSKTRWTPAGSRVLVVLGAVAVFSVAWATPAAITASPSLNNTAEALQLDPPAAPSQLSFKQYKMPYDDDGTHHGPGHNFSWYGLLSWKDNSTNEDGFIVETWLKQSGKWVFGWSGTMQANSTAIIYFDQLGSGYKYRVKAFNASGDSAWSNWAN